MRVLRRWWRWVSVGCAFIAVVASVTPASGQARGPEALSVAFSGPSECGPSDRLLTFSRELLGTDAERADVAVTAQVSSATERRYTLRLELRGAVSGDRTISGANCEEALRAGAVVIALAINPNALATPPAAARPVAAETDHVKPHATSVAEPSAPPLDKPETKPPVAKPPVVGDPPDPLPPALDDRDSNPTAAGLDTLVFGLFGRAAYGLAPAPRFGVKASVGLTWSDVQLRVHGYFDPSDEHPDALAGAVRFTSLGGGADLCAKVWDWSRLAATVCGGWSLTEVNASAPNVESPTAVDAFVSAGALAVGLGVGLFERVSLLAEGGYSIPVTRPRFVVDVEGAVSTPVFRVAPGPLVSLGLQFGI